MGLTGISLSSCTATPERDRADQPEVATAIQEQPTPSSAPDTGYASALQRHRPLGRINGDPRPLPKRGKRDSQFAPAISHAEAEQSYSLLIWHAGKLVVEHYVAPYDAQLRPESASMHKSVLALVVAAAIADGYIKSADDTVATYLDSWRGEPRGQITLRQLLTMSAGLKPLDASDGAASEAYRFWMNGESARATVLALEPEQPPGIVFSYQDTLPQLLLTIVEAATGQAYSTYLSERVWRRLGADDAYVWLNEADGYPRGYTALMATARDWLRVGLLIKEYGRVGNDQVIPAALIEQIIAPSATNPNYGWLVWRGVHYQPKRYYDKSHSDFHVVASEPYKTDDFIYFDGFGGQRVYISNKLDLVIVRQGALRIAWDDATLPNLVIDALQEKD